MPTWSDRAPVDYIDPTAFLYTGADPVWTPERENKQRDHIDAAAGLCALCGGDGYTETIDADSHRVCARCMRDRHSHSLPAEPTPLVLSHPTDPSVPVACSDDPGYVERRGVKVPERYARLMKG